MSKQLIFFDMLSRTSPSLDVFNGALPPGQSTAPTSTPSAPAYPDEQTMQGYRWQSFNASGRSTAELPFQREFEWVSSLFYGGRMMDPSDELETWNRSQPQNSYPPASMPDDIPIVALYPPPPRQQHHDRLQQLHYLPQLDTKKTPMQLTPSGIEPR
ncbi:hypothetical protein PSHT_08888 [Puccinia striiformis]|uniref:Uncharacterized protein n=3 Tax=Puccinia striiformis TaxID=27350 RepID=A0A2S4VKG5_9BASI|nr:hypothetical protein PSHT_08888 [Puccinia striiformis]